MIKSGIKKIAQSPYLNILAGIVLLLTAGYEVVTSIEEELLGAHHGVFFYAIVSIFRCLPEFMHGIEDLEKGEKASSGKV